MSGNRWISMKIYGHLWKCLNIAEHLWKYMKHYWKSLRTALNIYEKLWSSLKRPKHTEHLWISVNITEIVWELLWTSVKISGHLGKSLNITENFWKLLFQLWNALKTSVGALHSWLLFDLCYVNFVWTTFKKNTKEKQNKLIIRTKMQSKIQNRASIILL